MWKAISAALALALISGAAHAEGIQAQCGAETGRAYAVTGGVINRRDTGWYDDRVNGETIIRVDTQTGVADVRFKDATGLWRSVEDDGGVATFQSATSGPPPSFMVVVIYPQAAVETLIIGEVTGNRATLVHTVSRAMTPITNARVMVGECIVSSY